MIFSRHEKTSGQVEKGVDAALFIGKAALNKDKAITGHKQSEKTFIAEMPMALRLEPVVTAEKPTVMSQVENVDQVSNPKNVPGHPSNPNNGELDAYKRSMVEPDHE